MRRNIGCHTNRNTGSTVYQKVRKTARKDGRLLLCLIKVRYKIYSVFINVCQHFHGNLGKSRFCVSHSGGTVTIHGTEVTMSVYQHITGVPFLCQLNQCFINRTVTMRMIFTHGITNDTGTFTMWLIRTVIQLDHGIKNSSLYRLQTISYIRQGSGCNNTHGIINIITLHGFLQVYIMYFIKNCTVVHVLSSIP